MSKTICARCGLSHRRMNVQILARTLYRSAEQRHRVKAFGGAWAFDARFWNAHRGDFDRVEIAERDIETTWTASAADFDAYAVRKTLSAAFGEQVILPLSRWNRAQLRSEDPGTGEIAQEQENAVREIAVQSTLFSGVKFEPARSPRPRRTRYTRRRLL